MNQIDTIIEKFINRDNQFLYKYYRCNIKNYINEDVKCDTNHVKNKINYNEEYLKILKSLDIFRHNLDTFSHNLLLDIIVLLSNAICPKFINSIKNNLDNIKNNLCKYNYIVAPLLGDDCLFTCKQFCWALVNNILLIGLPKKITTADNKEMCPGEFLDHDIFHLSEFFYSYDNSLIERYKKIYLEIQDDELLIACLFFIIHESNYDLSKEDDKYNVGKYRLDFTPIDMLIDINKYQHIISSVINRYLDKITPILKGLNINYEPHITNTALYWYGFDKLHQLY